MASNKRRLFTASQVVIEDGIDSGSDIEQSTPAKVPASSSAKPTTKSNSNNTNNSNNNNSNNSASTSTSTSRLIVTKKTIPSTKAQSQILKPTKTSISRPAETGTDTDRPTSIRAIEPTAEVESPKVRPLIVQYAYANYRRAGTSAGKGTNPRYEADCNVCKATKGEIGSTTTNYIKHIREKHPDT